MLALKWLLTVAGALLFAVALAIPIYKLVFHILERRKKGSEEAAEDVFEIPWRVPLAFVVTALVPLLLAASIVVVPSGMGAVRISQIGGTEPGTLYPGLHFIRPLIESVQMFDLREHLFSTMAMDDGSKTAGPKNILSVQSREGLNIGLAVTVRYRLDPAKLSSVQAHLPQPADKQMVPPVVASAWHEIAPQYTVREIFSSKREEVRQRAAEMIGRKLAQDGIAVEEVMLSDVQLPQEYAQGLQSLLLKEQEDDQLGVQTEIQQKQIKISELQAEAEAAQKEQEAVGEAKSKVIEAKGEADAMQYTLPLKEKQIEQSKLEAEARKEATIQNAEADAQAKVIDSKAEQQRRDLLAESEANRVRVLAAANAERMTSEATLLNKSPLLINKIIAERLSDKIQVVMVPSDGKFFFANDVFKSMANTPVMKQEMDSESDADTKNSH
ncbi:SPFH domain-containing protein [Acidicapsa dinghuensis]|uniref:SPFH domain-containing protein n=1 Tax=Acidicapsa dinghuensis TaxID=2218256 RepID=A0ABW1ELQ0_9BACT|nr:SPFH domain-containing protein [Acidicapsa dinghuensis]